MYNKHVNKEKKHEEKNVIITFNIRTCIKWL